LQFPNAESSQKQNQKYFRMVQNVQSFRNEIENSQNKIKNISECIENDQSQNKIINNRTQNLSEELRHRI